MNDSLYQLIDESNRHHANRILVQTPSMSFTWKDLELGALRVETFIRSKKIPADSIVAIFLNPTYKMIISLLGTLKSGHTYLLLDPKAPDKRTSFIVEDANPAIVLTETLFDEILRLDISDLGKPHSTAKSAISYIAYTSGSTGKPNGALISHGATINHCLAAIRHFKIVPADRIPIVSSSGFDVAIEEIFPTLVAGACLILTGEDILDVTTLHETISHWNLTVLNVPASFWHKWVDHLEGSIESVPSCLRLVVTGSEKVLTSKIKKWFESHSTRNTNLLTAYGTTETAVTNAIFADFNEKDHGDLLSVPIGKAVLNNEIFILDGNLSVVTPGETGEICIAGYCLADGYLNRKELTAKRFVDVIIDGKCKRLYRTGDLGRCLPDGNIECLGRIDSQIKIRGLRIETNEIENAILGFSSVKNVAVVPIFNHDNEVTGLAAYLESLNFEQKDEENLRDYLADRIPHAMLPQHIVAVKNISLNASGKIDRKLLSVAASELRSIQDK